MEKGARLFCRQVVTDTGAELSESLIREGRATLPTGAADWVLDTRQWPGGVTEYADQLLAMTETVLSGPATSSARTPQPRSAA